MVAYHCVERHYSHFSRASLPSLFPSFVEILSVGGDAHKRNGKHEEVMVEQEFASDKRILWPQQESYSKRSCEATLS